MISIIVPIYNSDKYLNECIESILCQTYSNLEIILVDDGSTDRSLEIMDEYANKDNRVKVFHKENSGVSATRNLGLSYANGELISFCDSDDIIDENLYEVLVDKMNIKGVDRACGGYKYLYPNNRTVYCKPRLEDGIYTRQELLSIMIDDGTLSGFHFSGVYNSLFRKEIIDKYNIRFNESIRFNEDSLFSLEYALHSQGTYSLRSMPLYLYRQHAGSATSKKLLCDKYSQINEYLKKMDLDLEISNFDLQIKRRDVTVALWNILDISRCLSGNAAIKKIKNEISSENVRDNFKYINSKKLNRYKRIYFLLMKYKMSVLLYVLTKRIMPIASKYLSR